MSGCHNPYDKKMSDDKTCEDLKRIGDKYIAKIDLKSVLNGHATIDDFYIVVTRDSIYIKKAHCVAQDKSYFLTQSEELKALAEAAYPMPTILENYVKCVEFIKRVQKTCCNLIYEDCIACDALQLLREIGESE